MYLFVLGLNHLSAPLAVRERVVFSSERLRPALHALKAVWQAEWRREAHSLCEPEQVGDAEVAIVSTCNRTELYCAVQGTKTWTSDSSAAWCQRLITWLANYHALSAEELAPYLYVRQQDGVVRHVFSVAAGLDSMVLGETQILGQLKTAVRTAAEVGALGTCLHQLFQRSFSLAKDVRAKTEIGAHSVSMAAAAVRLAQRIFEDIAGQSVLLIGAGEMIERCAVHFAAHAPRKLAIANRTMERGRQLAQRVNGTVLTLSEASANLHEFDIVLSCTASTLPIIGLGAVERALRARRRRPMFMVDLAVPRDIEPEVKGLEDVFLYTVDDLGSIVSEGRELRQGAVMHAEAMIETRVQHFMEWINARARVPAIHAMHRHAQALRVREVERAHKRLAQGEAPAQVIETLAHALTQKWMHGPLRALADAPAEERDKLIRLVPELFKITRP